MNEQELINKRMKKARDARKKQIAEKGKETYLNKQWLFSRRCVDKMSLDKIAEICKVEYDEIWASLKKLGIPLLIIVGREAWLDWIEKHEKRIAYRAM